MSKYSSQTDILMRTKKAEQVGNADSGKMVKQDNYAKPGEKTKQGRKAKQDRNAKQGEKAKQGRVNRGVDYSVYCIFVSPTGNTRDAVRAVAKGIAKKTSNSDFFTIDITPQDERDGVYDFGPEDIVIVGTPTYAGRIPNKLLPYFEEAIIGNGALGVAIVTYGNRAYDDSLKELAEVMSTNDFNLISAVAVPSEHAFVPELATGRPDEADINKLIEIGISIGQNIIDGKYIEDRLSNKYTSDDAKTDDIVSRIPGRTYEDMKYYIPKKKDGEPAVFLKAMPKTDVSKCDGCGECRRVCPMGCFGNSIAEPEGVCIKCQGCVHICPNGAKYFDDEDFLSHKEYLKDNYADKVREIEAY